MVLCCESDPKLAQSDLEGDWITITAIHDGTDQPAWEGRVVSFEQSNNTGGIYKMANTLNDSIWSTSDSWT